MKGSTVQLVMEGNVYSGFMKAVTGDTHNNHVHMEVELSEFQAPQPLHQAHFETAKQVAAIHGRYEDLLGTVARDKEFFRTLASERLEVMMLARYQGLQATIVLLRAGHTYRTENWTPEQKARGERLLWHHVDNARHWLFENGWEQVTHHGRPRLRRKEAP